MKWGDRDYSKWKNAEWSKWTDAAKSGDWSKLAEAGRAPTGRSGPTRRRRRRALHAERFANDLHSKIKRDFESRMSRKYEAKSARYERKMRARFNRQTQKYGGVTIDPAQDMPPPPQFKSDAERQAYERARKRAHRGGRLLRPSDVVRNHHRLPVPDQPDYDRASADIRGSSGRRLDGALESPATSRRCTDGDGFISAFSSPRLRAKCSARCLQEKEQLRTEKQASLDELTATFAHEIRNPIAAAKSLVQQMGEDPTSHENVEYAKVALDELARVERSVSHLLKYAKEEDYKFENVNLAWVLDGALTQMRSKLEANSVVGVARILERTDGSRRRRQAAPGVLQHDRQRDRRDGIDHRRAASSSSRSRTMAPGWRR